MNSLKINIPKGFQIDNFDKATGEVTFAEIPKKPRERINGWLDILDHHNHTQESFNEWCAGLRPHEVGTRECEMIVAAYNGRQLTDPLPVYGPNTGIKAYGLYEMPSPSGAGFSLDGHDYWWSCSYVGARLAFYGDDWKENLYDANEKFLSHFEKMMTL